MSRLTIALWSGLAAVTFGTFQSSFPADWGGAGGLFVLIVLVILPLGWTFEYLRRRVRKQG